MKRECLKTGLDRRASHLHCQAISMLLSQIQARTDKNKHTVILYINTTE